MKIRTRLEYFLAKIAGCQYGDGEYANDIMNPKPSNTAEKILDLIAERSALTITAKVADQMGGVVGPVALNANGESVYCSSGDKFIGIATSTFFGDETSYVVIQRLGVVTVPYSGSTAPTTGWNYLTANGMGGVKVDLSGRQYIVTSVDTENRTLTMVM